MRTIPTLLFLILLAVFSSQSMAQNVFLHDVNLVERYRTAAEQGDAHAQAELGTLYRDGRGVAQDDREALKWYRRSAEQGNPRGQSNLGFMYKIGRGVEQNTLEALKWYRLAADQGDPEAQRHIGTVYQLGADGLSMNRSEALRWFTMALEQYRAAAARGDADAQIQLGQIYEKGSLGLNTDYREAIQWYKMAADQGSSQGQVALGQMYQRGLGTTQDDREAVRLYRLSADQGDINGQWFLGKMYETGRGGLTANPIISFALISLYSKAFSPSATAYVLAEHSKKLSTPEKEKARLIVEQMTLQRRVTPVIEAFLTDEQRFLTLAADRNTPFQPPPSVIPSLPAATPPTPLAQTPAGLPKPLPVNLNERRVALVIGNSTYGLNPLNNPTNDATDIAKSLRSLGFDVALELNATLRQMRAATRKFDDLARNADVALIFFAGHGIEAKGKNYMIPVDAQIEKEFELDDQAYDAGQWLSMLEGAKGNNAHRVNIVILDACRDNPVSRGWRSANRGLGRMDAPSGTILVYSTAPGKVAGDGLPGQRNSPFTKSFLKAIQKPNIPIELVLKDVRKEVLIETKGEQVPWENSSLVGDFVFKR